MKFNELKNMSTTTIRAKITSIMVRFLLWLALAIMIGVVLMKVVSYGSARYACHTRWVESTLEYKYTLRGGCLLKLDNGWLPSSNYRVQ